MRKLLAIACTITFLLCGCVISKNSVETMEGWSFQYNAGTNDYSLFFSLLNKSKKEISADANVSIKIVNDNDEIVYQGVKNVARNDFGTYTDEAVGERYMADVRIAYDEIKKGSSSNGTVYFEVNGDAFAFDEANCDAFYCLPVDDISISIMDLPAEVIQTGFSGTIESKIRITDVDYNVDNDLTGATVSFCIFGQKTYGTGGSLSYDKVGYRLYSGEYLIDSGEIYLGTGLKSGDKFKDDSLVIYDLTPGENYQLEFENLNW